MAQDAKINIKILGDDSNFSAALGKAGGSLSKFGGMAAGGAAVAGAAIVGVGVAAYKLGDDFDAAYDTIRSGSGATGEALEGLKNDFKATLGTVPDDMGLVSQATADLNTRLGLTGEPLQKMSKQFLDLGRVSGEEVPKLITSATRSFQDWGLSANEQSKALDHMYAVSQNTGIGVSELGDLMVKTGAPMRTLGYTMEEQANLLGKWNKEGVNTEIIFSGIRSATGAWADAGKDASKEFKNVIAEIGKAPDSSKAAEIAIETFGRKAGPDLADAVLGGRFELDELNKTLGDTSGTIGENAEDVKDFAEKWGEFKNKALLKIEPLVTGIFSKVGELFEKIDFEKIEAMFDTAKKKIEDFQKTPAFGIIKDAIIRIKENFMAFFEQLKKHEPTFKKIGIAIGAVVIAVIWLTSYAQKLFFWIADKVIGAIGWLIDIFISLGTGAADLWNNLEAGFGVIREKWDEFYENFKQGLSQFGAFFTETIPGFFSSIGPTIGEKLDQAWEWVKIRIKIGILSAVIVFGKLPGQIWEAIKGLPGKLWDIAKAAWNLWDQIVGSRVRAAIGFFLSIPGKVWDALKGLPGKLWEAAKVAWNLFNRTVGEKIREAVEFVKGIPGKFVAGLQKLPGKLVSAFKSAWHLANNTLGEKVREAGEVVKSLPGKALDALKGIGTTLSNAGKDLIQGFIDGIKDKFQVLQDTFNWVTDKIPDWKGPEDKDKKLLTPAGQEIIKGLNRGLTEAFPETENLLNAFTSKIAGGISPTLNVNGAGNGSFIDRTTLAIERSKPQGTVVNLYIDNINGDDGRSLVEQIRDELSKGIL